MSEKKELTVSDKALKILNNSTVWDMTLPWDTEAMDEITLPRFKKAGFDFISLTVDMPSLEATVQHIAKVHSFIRTNCDKIAFARNVGDIDKAKELGKLAVTFHLQETNPLNGDINMISTYYELGVRHMLLAYNQKNRVGDGCAERGDGGLSRFGVKVVQEMNRVGMLVDGSHTGYRTTMEAMEVSNSPFIFSHCNAWGVVPHYRNIKDDQIKACADTGGVIGVNGLGEFLDDPSASSESMFKHIDYMVDLVGPQHVGIGLDYVKHTTSFWNWVRNNPEIWPLINNKPHDDTKFGQPEQIKELCELMIKHQYAESDISAILGDNFARVARQVWK